MGHTSQWSAGLEFRRLDSGVGRKPKELRTFQVLPHRWKVERTLGWLNRSRRLSKDYEHDTGSSEAMGHLAMIHLMLKRLCPI